MGRRTSTRYKVSSSDVSAHNSDRRDEDDLEVDDENTVSGQGNASDSVDCNGTREDDDQHTDEQVKDAIQECLSNSPEAITLANKSSGSINLISTESEERHILESHSAK